MEVSLRNDLETTTHIKHYVGMSMNQMRHLEIDRIIEDKAVLSLIDFGCSEGLLLQKLGRSEKLQLLVGVDIEESALSYCSLNTYPENIQQTIQFSREIDQNIYVYEGDVTKKYKQLKQFNVQLITLVELIEHLQQEQLPKAVQNVFGYLRPKYCFVSTPNKEFNDFFDFHQNQLRHWDHKFEWNRAQFQTFCNQIEANYGYSFIISGVGQHVSDSSKGHCTQYALFTKKQEKGTAQLGQESDELVEKAHYCNKSWRNSVDKIMRGLLFKSLYYSEEITFEGAVQFLEKELMGDCLKRSGEIVDKKLLLHYLGMNEGDFSWDDFKYRLKEKPQESEVQDLAYSENNIQSNFQHSFSKSSLQNDLSISESYQKKPPLEEPTLTIEKPK